MPDTIYFMEKYSSIDVSSRYEVIIHMSLIRAQDFVQTGAVLNPYWAQLLNTVDEFDQLMELQKREIASSVKDFNLKRVELVRQFSEFKDSLRFEGEVPKQQIYFIQMNEFSSIFKGYHHAIIDIIEKVVLQPKVLAELLGSYVDNKRLRFQDFFQNIVFNIYPYYLPKSKKAPMVSFINQLFEKWPYSIELMRPTHYTLVDQAIGGLMKAPEIVCYIEKIVTYFLQESGKCKMSTFAFDEEAISNQLQIKKQANATFSLYNQEKAPSWKDKFKGFFRKEKKNEDLIESRLTTSSEVANQQSFLSHQSSEHDKTNLIDIMSKRQTQFFELIHKTAQFILSQELPVFLCRLLSCFDNYLNNRLKDKKENRLKHYCYFVMTNLVLAELHNKFTASHQQSGMSPADLQNISEIIKFLNALFQGLILESEKYRTKALHYFDDFRKKIEIFYQSALQRGRMEQTDQGELLQTLLVHYQRSVVLSMNDLYLIISMLKTAKPTSYLRHPEQLLQFLKGKEGQQLFDSMGSKKGIRLKGGNRSFECAYLVYESKSPSVKEIIDYYLTIDEPMAEVPFLRQIFLGESNLDIQQTLQIQNDLKLIRKLPIKEIRGYLGKIAHKFKDLRVKDGRSIQLKFQQSFKNTLARSLRRKEWLLYYRAELGQHLSGESHLMTYFTRQLNSAQFYERMAHAFCDSVKLKIYLNIENNVFCIHKSAQQLKKIQINTLMVAKDDSKSNSSNQNYILRNSFKIFENYKDLIRCLAKNQITMMALAKGRKVDEFNETFQKICEAIVSKIGQFVAKRQILQMLSEQKLALIVVKKMQDKILSRFKEEKIPNEKDKQLQENSKKVNKNDFWKKDLEMYSLDRQFLVIQGVEKFKAMTSESNVWARLKHFEDFFKIIFTILGFTMPKNKISAEIVNPLVQYIILECSDLPHHDCLYSIQALKWRQTPEDAYHLTLYQSSLTYIRQLMPKDYPL